MRIDTRIMKIALAIGLMAIAMLGLGLPSALAFDGPTPPRLADPVGVGAAAYPVTFDEVQTIYFEGATVGSYQLRIQVPPATSFTNTSTIFFNTSASELDTTIEAAIGAGTVTVVGTGPSQYAPFTITFGGAPGLDIVTEVFNFSTMANLDGELVTPIVTSVQQGATLVTADVAPHGGYGSLTDYCLQCHQVHSGRTGNTNGEYALLAEVSVTSTCATCHGYLGKSPTGAGDPGFPGQEGTASLRAVYTADPIHNIGYSSSRTDDGWSYGWTFGGGPTGASTRRAGAGVSTAYGGGFYCGTCHTPHGEFGQLINARWTYSSASTDPDGAGPLTGAPVMAKWENNTKIFWDNPLDAPDTGYAVMYLWQPPNSGDPWKVCTALTGGGLCYDAQIHDSEGQLVSLYGYKLLSYVPNHQYPTLGTGANAGLYLQPNGTYAALPPGGMFADNGYVFGNLARDALYPRDELASRVMLGHLQRDSGTGNTIYVTEYSAGDASAPTAPAIITADIENQALPFKIRIDDEIMMVTDRAPDSTADGFRTYNLTVTRSTEDPKEPWVTTSTNPAPPAVGHNINADVTLVPTLLVNDGPSPLGLKSGMRLPLHVKFSAGSGSNLEIAVLMKRTQVTATQGLYTVGRAVDGSPQTESHTATPTTNLLAQTGSSVATVKSWGTDIYDHDSAIWCGTCHTYSVDAKFGGQWHSHPTGCTSCHGNPTDDSSADFPHSSTNEFMLQEFPDALCIVCHGPTATGAPTLP